MAKYKVLVGGHTQNKKFYGQNSIVETDYDLLKMNRADPPKFARIDGDEEVVSTRKKSVAPHDKVSDGYDEMSLDDLQEIALGEEINFTGRETREELISMLRVLK